MLYILYVYIQVKSVLNVGSLKTKLFLACTMFSYNL